MRGLGEHRSTVLEAALLEGEEGRSKRGGGNGDTYPGEVGVQDAKLQCSTRRSKRGGGRR
jgi:hypothetical protein